MRAQCGSCRYWSELIARSAGNGLEALCLSGDGPYAGQYTRADGYCPKHQVAADGAVDDPRRKWT